MNNFKVVVTQREGFGGDTHEREFDRYMRAVEYAKEESCWESTQTVQIVDMSEDRVVASSEGDYADAPAGAEEPASAEAGHDYAVVERAEGFDMDWYYDGAGWSSQPVYYFSTMEAAYRHAAERRQENEFPVYSYHVVIRGENQEAA